MTTWTPERITRVEELVNEGNHTYAEIGKIMDTSKNAIVGIVHRYITLKDKIKTHIPDERKSPVRQHGALSVNYKKKYAPLKFENATREATTSWPRDGICLTVIGEPRNRTGCSNKRMKGKSYCKDCCEAYYVVSVKK